MIYYGKGDLQSSNVLNSIQEGSLDMLDFQTKVASLNIHWFCKHLSDELNAGCKCMFDYWFEYIGGTKVVVNCK